jgi:aspartate 1-decarboxylase
MLREFCRAKIHRATLTARTLAQGCAVTIDRALLDAALIAPFEKVQVLNASNGSRVELYARAAPRNSGCVSISGPAARWFEEGDLVIILSFCFVEGAFSKKPRVVFVDTRNAVVKVRQ